jgi:hypothetical protein
MKKAARRQPFSPQATYFRLRAKYPVTMEPKPIKPSKGSGEAVCGSLPPWLF